MKALKKIYYAPTIQKTNRYPKATAYYKNTDFKKMIQFQIKESENS
ncbi:hypothetical protein ACQKKK_17835 [Peribacillus sp. NPDC006672]